MDKKRGFTLIEMMVVVLIIGILAAVVIVSVNNSRINARDAKRVQDIDTINSAIQMYAEANSGNYPPNLNALVTGNFIPTLPKDPKTGVSYVYTISGNEYKIKTAVEMEGVSGISKAQNDGVNNKYFEMFSANGAGL